MELENQTDCMRDLEEISAQEKNFTAGLEELRTWEPLLVNFVDTEVMSKLVEKVEAMQLRKTEVKQQLEAYREVQQRYVLMYSDVHYSKCLCVWIQILCESSHHTYSNIECHFNAL